MEAQEQNNIYKRLLDIKMDLKINSIPDPDYIKQKIGECHVYIEEIEKFYIKASQNISTTQRALNNIQAEYDSKKEEIITENEEVKKLPSIKDREARANSLLKNEIEKIHEYENKLSDLNNLLRAINLKQKNLNRTNTDIKMLLRMVDSQMRLGSPNFSDSAARSLIEEMKKTQINQDIFGETDTKVEENKTLDPSEPVDVNELLKNSENEESDEESDQEIEESLLDPDHEPGMNISEIDEEKISENIQENRISEDVIQEAENSISNEVKIDLDAVIEPEKRKTEGGEKENEKTVKPVTEIKGIEKTVEPYTKEKVKKDSNEIDIDSLLKQYI